MFVRNAGVSHGGHRQTSELSTTIAIGRFFNSRSCLDGVNIAPEIDHRFAAGCH